MSKEVSIRTSSAERIYPTAVHSKPLEDASEFGALVDSPTRFVHHFLSFNGVDASRWSEALGHGREARSNLIPVDVRSVVWSRSKLDQSVELGDRRLSNGIVHGHVLAAGQEMTAAADVAHSARVLGAEPARVRMAFRPALRWLEVVERLFRGDDPGVLLRSYPDEFAVG